MNKAQSTSRPHQLLNSAHNLVVVVRRHGLHDDTHWPGHAWSLVRTARGIKDRSKAEIRVGVAENKVARALVGCVRVGLVAEMWDAEEGGDVGVVLAIGVSLSNLLPLHMIPQEKEG